MELNLKPHSKQLIKIMKRFKLKINTNTKSDVFSNTSRGFLEKIYNQLLLVENKWWEISSNVYASQETVKTNSGFQPQSKGSHYESIPDKFRQVLIENTKTEYKCNFMINSRNITIHFVKLDDSLKMPSVKKIIYRMYLWLSIADNYASRLCAETLNIYLYFISHKKRLPDLNGEPLNWVHANTAFTTTCSKENEINIFREEEWFKVFIHETFHCLGLDFSSMNSMVGNQEILNVYSTNITDLRLYETYCEMWAELMNTMFIAFFSAKSKHDIRNIFMKMNTLIRNEQIFSVFQCIKVLGHHGLNYRDILQDAGNKVDPKYHEKTNAFCYYVLKSVLMVHINEYIEWIIKYNKSIQFKHTDPNILAYSQLIITHSKSPVFYHYLDVIEPYFQPKLNRKNRKSMNKNLNKNLNKRLGGTKKHQSGSFEKSTLRMTVNEIQD
jgi:hypothetical protein